MFWIYQDQTNSLDVLEDKYNVHYWNDWEVEGVPANNGDKRSIGQRYGAVVKKHDIINRLLAQLEANPWNRRNVISLWDYEAFEETAGLQPCAFQTMTINLNKLRNSSSVSRLIVNHAWSSMFLMKLISLISNQKILNWWTMILLNLNSNLT